MFMFIIKKANRLQLIKRLQFVVGNYRANIKSVITSYR